MAVFENTDFYENHVNKRKRVIAHFFGFPFAKIFFSFQILLFYDFLYLQSLQCKQNIVAVNLVGISTSVLQEDALCELGKYINNRHRVQKETIRFFTVYL